MTRPRDYESLGAGPGMVEAATVTGDRMKTLRALRDKIAIEIDECNSATGVAALSARLLDVLAAIEKVPAEAKGSPLDELKSRRRSVPGSALSA